MILANTYEEVYEILSLMDKATVMKIPIKVLNNIKEQRNPEYQTRIDKNDIFNENNVNKETIDLLCYLDYHYWMDEDKKDEVNQIRKQKVKEIEDEKRQRYDPNNIFSTNKTVISIENNTCPQNSLVEYKESIFIKFKNFIFKILHINK